MHTPPFSIRNTALHYLRLCVSQIFSGAELTIFTTASVITNTTRVLLLMGGGAQYQSVYHHMHIVLSCRHV